MLLAGPDGDRAGRRYAAGVALALLFLAVLRSRPGTATRDGLQRRKGEDSRRSSASRRARAAFPFGAFSMATNLTTLALVAPAAKEISNADVDIAVRTMLGAGCTHAAQALTGLTRNWLLARLNVAVFASSIHGLGSTPETSWRNWAKSWLERGQLSPRTQTL